MTYEREIARIRRANTMYILGVASLIILLFIICIIYAVNLTQENKQQIEDIRNSLIHAEQEHRETTEENRRLNLAQVCILTYPASERTQEMIDGCLQKHNVDTTQLK